MVGWCFYFFVLFKNSLVSFILQQRGIIFQRFAMVDANTTSSTKDSFLMRVSSLKYLSQLSFKFFFYLLILSGGKWKNRPAFLASLYPQILPLFVSSYPHPDLHSQSFESSLQLLLV